MMTAWSIQVNHRQVFMDGTSEDTAFDHERYCLDCHDVLPHDLPFDDPCSAQYLIREENML